MLSVRRSRQAKGSFGNATRDLQEILIDFRCVRPPVQTSANLLDNPLVSIGIEALRGEATSYRLGVGEDRRKFLAERNCSFGMHR
jgi:hypothetical protein